MENESPKYLTCPWCIQGSNASIIKRAMGCGFDKNNKPYLWHILPQFKAKLLSMVHDELIIQCPKRFGQQVAEAVADAFKRAAAEVIVSGCHGSGMENLR